MDDVTRHQRIARRFLVSIVQQHGPLAAPVILRRWADELEQLAEEAQRETREALAGRFIAAVVKGCARAAQKVAGAACR